jgi:hypothetical protein
VCNSYFCANIDDRGVQLGAGSPTKKRRVEPHAEEQEEEEAEVKPKKRRVEPHAEGQEEEEAEVKPKPKTLLRRVKNLLDMAALDSDEDGGGDDDDDDEEETLSDKGTPIISDFLSYPV